MACVHHGLRGPGLHTQHNGQRHMQPAFCTAYCSRACKRQEHRQGHGPLHASKQQQGASDGSAEKPAPSRRTVLGGLLPPACGCLCCSSPGGGSNSHTGWYGRYFAWAMANTMEVYEQAVAGLKQQLFADLLHPGSGVNDVLEVGIGTGPNFKYYAAAGQQPASITGLDPNPAMQQYAMQNAAAAGLSDRVRLVEGSAGRMPFDSAAFDAAVITLVLCSVPDAVAALQEVRRVLKPGSPLLLIEHVVAQPDQRWLCLQQELLNPFQRAVADGCNLNRDTLAALHAAGFDSKEVRRLQIEGLGPLSPHIAGIAAA